jgi:hypothetical protein
MNYEKKYKNALEWARQVKDGRIGFVFTEVEKVFPELKESDDEKIRRALTGLLKFGFNDGSAITPGSNITKEDALAWLEKQVEQKSDWSDEDCYKVQRICMYLNEAKKYYADITEVRECIEWLKSLKERINYKKGDEE